MATDLYLPRHLAGVDELTAYLTGNGVLHPESVWLDGLRHVPRHLFVPTRAWSEPMDDRSECLIDRDRDPDSWWRAVYSNCAIITQRGDGDTDITDTSAAPTSSLSCPHVAFEFLDLLAVDSHHHVLEIGTGTGWTAAMLAWRLQNEQVVTVEVDPAVAALAAANLSRAGFSPRTLVGDGALLEPTRRRYDRIHVTCGVRDIPYAWIEQTRPGGAIVLPYMPPHGRFGEQLRLDVLDDGTATGRFYGGATFMMMRSQRRALRRPPHPGAGVVTTSVLDPRAPTRDVFGGFGLALAADAPHLTITSAGWEQHDSDVWGWTVRLRDLAGDAWAIATAHPENGETEIVQGGGRRLWDDLETAYFQWLRVGRPARDRFRITVTAQLQVVRLDPLR